MIRWLLLAAALLSIGPSPAAATHASQCASGLLISATTGHVLHRLRLSVASVVSDGHGGWFTAGTRLTHLRHDDSADPSWHSRVLRGVSYTNRESSGILARPKACMRRSRPSPSAAARSTLAGPARKPISAVTAT